MMLRKRIVFRKDTYLNWFLGIILVLFPKVFENLISSNNLFPNFFYQFIGLIFLGYAFWQTRVFKKTKLSSTDWKIGSLMAGIPVILLTYALLFMNLEIYFMSELLLWIGNLYMAFLVPFYLDKLSFS